MKDETHGLIQIKTERKNARQFKRNYSRRVIHFKSGRSTKAEMSCDPKYGGEIFLANIKTCQTVTHHILL
jgi:hypothetical protein